MWYNQSKHNFLNKNKLKAFVNTTRNWDCITRDTGCIDWVEEKMIRTLEHFSQDVYDDHFLLNPIPYSKIINMKTKNYID
jgi:hypothetical protein